MGKKPALGIVSALCVGLALTGCRNCSSCHSDNARVAKDNPAAFKPQPTFQTNSAAAAPASQGWDHSAPTLPKATVAAPVDVPAPVGMEKTGLRPTEPVAISKPAPSGVQPATLVTAPPLPPPPPDAVSPVEPATSHFPPAPPTRILPPPPALTSGSSLPPLGNEHAFPEKVEESTGMPLPPPPPPPSLSHSPPKDAPPPLSSGTLPPVPPPPPGPNG